MAKPAAKAEVLDPFELQFSDVVLLSSSSIPPSSDEEIDRFETISAAVMEALGPSGPGLLAVTGVPKAPALRRALLPLARKLALLGRQDRARVLKEHGLGSDVPLKNVDRCVSSFALQLKYTQDLSSMAFSGCFNNMGEDSHKIEEDPLVDMRQNFHDYEFKLLGDIFKELGLCMIELGRQLARICDKAIGGGDLERSIIDSGSAKGRLIHYHSTVDNLILKETNSRTRESKRKAGAVRHHSLFNGSATSGNVVRKLGQGLLDEKTQLKCLHSENYSMEDRSSKPCLSNLWQQWHYDYGIFTVLTSPLFMLSCQGEGCSCVSNSHECSSPDGHTYLQLYDTTKNKISVVRYPPESFILQVGEAADILSRGKLRSTLHSVGRPCEMENLSREMFVVFLQPAWSKTLSYSGSVLETETKDEEKLASSNETSGSWKGHAVFSPVVAGSHESHRLMEEILTKIPPLSSRFRDGMTFAEFSHETTKQYYSGSGTQSMR